VLQSKSDLLRRIFETEETTKNSVLQSSAAHAPGKLSFISVGSKFRSQLTLLMDKLRSTVCMLGCLLSGGNNTSLTLSFHTYIIHYIFQSVIIFNTFSVLFQYITKLEFLGHDIT